MENLPRYSRAFIKEQIKKGLVLVNQKTSKPSAELTEGDEVSFDLPETPENRVQPNPEIKLDIIFEDQDVIVLNKPAGISVHPRFDKSLRPMPEEVSTTMVSGLLAYYPPLGEVGDNPELRPGLVHRLDKDTSGVMIVAKTEEAFFWLKEEFANRHVAKKYIALVEGKLDQKQGQIKNLLRRSPDPTKQQVASEGREAITEYLVQKEFKNYTLVEALPKTGRFHQIRVQFAWLGHPVAGDKKYGSKAKIPGLNRHFLHAQELEITLPRGQKQRFFSPLPPELDGVLLALEKNS